ncbi:MAG: hypothetical protein WD871_05105 [Xanthobacteraceae bacterium]
MMPAEVYGELYRLAREGPDLDVLEIGGAAGAGAIALALGLIEANKRSGVVVVEKLAGGSRARFGDYQANLSIIERNFRAFGVVSRVRLFPRNLTWANAGEVKALLRTPQIGALVIDADGNIHRDLTLFGPMLAPGAAVVIDDYRDDPGQFDPLSGARVRGGPKLVQVFRLVNHLVEAGVLRVKQQVRSTVFCELTDLRRLDRADCELVIEQTKRDLDALFMGAA